MGCRHEVDAADPAAAVVAHQAISAEWLSAALQHQGIAAVVGDFTVETISAGQLGEVRRCHLRYSGRCPPQAPTSLIGKFPSADDVAASTGRRLGIYRAEVMFYRELAARAAIRTPRPDVAAIDDPHNFVLLLEDLAPATAGDHLRGCAVADARKAWREGARLHAAFWNDDTLAAQPWRTCRPARRASIPPPWSHRRGRISTTAIPI